jgi:FtsZ-binding cell division protein ZapB
MKKKSPDQMTLSGTEEEILTRLHQRVEKAIAMIQDLRREREALKAKLEDCERFQKERGEIRSRIQSILSNLESLDVSE